MTIDTLLFDGGGSLGITYIGVIKALEKTNFLSKIKVYSGTSIGSIICLMLVLGYTSSEMLNLLFSFDIQKGFSLNLLNFIKNGVYGDDIYLIHTIKSIIKMKYQENITFQELYNLTNKKLIINTTCICDNKPFYFDYMNNPDMPVWLSIRMSISIPGIFPSILYKDKKYVDGGLSPLPIHNFNQNNLLIITFHIRYMNVKKESIFYTFAQIINSMGRFNYDECKNVIILNPNSSVLATPTHNEKIEMIKIGFCSTIKYIKNITQ